MNTTKSDTTNDRQLSIWDCLQRDTAEQEEEAGVSLSPRMAETESTEGTKRRDLLETITEPQNLKDAAKRVIRNNGGAGIDGMTCQELMPWLEENMTALIQQIQDGKYRPQAVRRKAIPKDNGKIRQLGIPTVIDRTIQQAICQILVPVYEEQFSEHSYGFRPNRSAHMALEQSLQYANEGYRWVVDMDLEKFFDTVNQSKLVQLLSNTIEDGRVISLIHKYLRAGIMDDGMFKESREGVPQGGPLSPLLGNIMLNESDQELERRGHRFVRYADDMMIFCKSKRAAQRVLETVTRYLEDKLFLKVNREKTKVAYINYVDFLGHGFYGEVGGETKLRASKKSVRKLKDKLRALTQRNKPMSTKARRVQLNRLITGWVNYFKLAKMKRILESIDGWLRRRIRSLTWKRWKTPQNRERNLRKTELDERHAKWMAHTSRGYWFVAGSHWMNVAIPKKYFDSAGYISLTDYYVSIT